MFSLVFHSYSFTFCFNSLFCSFRFSSYSFLVSLPLLLTFFRISNLFHSILFVFLQCHLLQNKRGELVWCPQKINKKQKKRQKKKEEEEAEEEQRKNDVGSPMKPKLVFLPFLVFITVFVSFFHWENELKLGTSLSFEARIWFFSYLILLLELTSQCFR